jgi:hypothetical protein
MSRDSFMVAGASTDTNLWATLIEDNRRVIVVGLHGLPPSSGLARYSTYLARLLGSAGSWGESVLLTPCSAETPRPTREQRALIPRNEYPEIV